MSGLLTLYRTLTGAAQPGLKLLLSARGRRGKEDASRIGERMGRATRPRPEGFLLWIHAASVGETQAALILIDRILKLQPAMTVLVTSGTVTSAKLMETRLPASAIHQFVPLDSPSWVASFLDHWRPDTALWMESELWPNLLAATGERKIPVVLINARLSDRSYARWRLVGKTITALLARIDLVLAQTDIDRARFTDLGAKRVVAAGNVKLSATPLPCDELSLSGLQLTIGERPVWVYASTHDGEEELACRVHKKLREHLHGLLTIIVPRHPERREAIAGTCFEHGLKFRLRSQNVALPAQDDDIYIADTLGELGLFYRLCDVAMIGRSFSRDGGGGHNPIEAAQLGCAVMTGPHNQFQRPLYDAMLAADAVIVVEDEADLAQTLYHLFTDPAALSDLKQRGEAFSRANANVVDSVIEQIAPYLAGKSAYHAV